jgi:carbamoyltransferase
MRTEIDYLVLENFLLAKADQPPQPRSDAWKKKFTLD